MHFIDFGFVLVVVMLVALVASGLIWLRYRSPWAWAPAGFAFLWMLFGPGPEGGVTERLLLLTVAMANLFWPVVAVVGLYWLVRGVKALERLADRKDRE